MNTEALEIVDLLLTNGLIIWLALRMVKRVDDLDTRVDQHETRITVLETEVTHHARKRTES